MCNKYDKMTHDDEVRIISDLMEETATGELLGIPGVWEAVREYFNNDMLAAWDREHENEYGTQKPCPHWGANCCDCGTCDTCDAEYGHFRDKCPDCGKCTERAQVEIDVATMNMRDRGGQ